MKPGTVTVKSTECDVCVQKTLKNASQRNINMFTLTTMGSAEVRLLMEFSHAVHY